MNTKAVRTVMGNDKIINGPVKKNSAADTTFRIAFAQNALLLSYESSSPLLAVVVVVVVVTLLAIGTDTECYTMK